MTSEVPKMRKVADLHNLPENPRSITKEGMKRLVASIKTNGFYEHRPLAIVERDGLLVVLDGNQRLKAAKKLKLKEVPTVLYIDTTPEEEREIILRGNINNGDWDKNILETEDLFKGVDYDAIGLVLPDLSLGHLEGKPQKGKRAKVSQDPEPEDDPADEDNGNDSDDEDFDDEENEKEAFYRSMFKDVLIRAIINLRSPLCCWRSKLVIWNCLFLPGVQTVD